MRKFKIFLFSVVFVAVSFSFSFTWAESKRDELKKQFLPSSNIRQIQNTVADYEFDSYDEPIDQERVSSNKAKRHLGRERRDSQSLYIGEYAVYQSQYTTTIEEDIAFIKGKISLEVFKKNGWVKIPLASSNAGLKEVSLNRKPSFVIREGNKYVLLIGKPGVYNLDLEFFIQVNREREHGPGSLSFPVLPSPISVIDVEMQETEVEVFVEPSIKIETERLAKKTLATVVLPFTESVVIRWSKAIAKEIIPEVKLDPKIYAETSTLVSVGDGVAKCFSRIKYSILQTEVSNLRVMLDDDVGILDVKGNQLRDWKLKTKDGKQILDIYLNYGVKGTYVLDLVYERNIGSGSVTAQIPEISVLGTQRQRGVVGIEARANIELAFDKVETASTIDVKELPQDVWSRAKNPIVLAFKYLKFPYSAVIDVTKHEEIAVLIAAVDNASYVTLFTEEGKILTKATFQMRNNVKQFVRLSMPKDAVLWSCFVSGKPVKPAKDKDGKILIPLEKSQILGEELAQFPVEIVYLTKKQKMKFWGSLKLSLPQLDIPASELIWSTYLPNKFEYYKFKGDVDLIISRAHPRSRSDISQPVGLDGGSFKNEDRKRAYKREESLGLYSLGKSVSRPQAVMEDNLLEEVQTAQSRGALPIKISVPQRGKLFRFSKLLVTDESPWVSIKYMRSMHFFSTLRKFAFLILAIGLVAILLKKFILPKINEKKEESQ